MRRPGQKPCSPQSPKDTLSGPCGSLLQTPSHTAPNHGSENSLLTLCRHGEPGFSAGLRTAPAVPRAVLLNAVPRNTFQMTRLDSRRWLYSYAGSEQALRMPRTADSSPHVGVLYFTPTAVCLHPGNCAKHSSLIMTHIRSESKHH